MDMKKYMALFVEEANEHLQDAGKHLASLEAGRAPAEHFNALFRHFHSIKGMAASMSLEPISRLSHAVEDLFDALRKEQIPFPEQLVEVVMEAVDVTSAMVAEASRSGPGEPLRTDPGPQVRRLRDLLPAQAQGAEEGERRRPPAFRIFKKEAKDGPAPRVHECHVVIDPAAEFPGARAVLVLNRLENLGQILETEPDRARMMRPGFDGKLRIRLSSSSTAEHIAATLQGMLDVLESRVSPVAPDPPPAPEEPPAAREEKHRTVHVRTETLDLFLDAIAELITCRGALSESIRTRDLLAAQPALDKLSESIDRLREQVMLIRLIPFEEISPALSRAVRELCRATGKRVSLEITGAEVSLDRSVLLELVDPLLHILRNSVDHGIEEPGERSRAGKPPSGVIRIDVSRQSDQVLVVVEDDGRGMNTDAIRSAAVERGLVTAEDLSAMSDEQILMLTTVPGFSTAMAVTEISGRGVGLDVVRTRIEALRGHLHLRSLRGRGTRIEMNLPPSVSVIEAFLVRCGTSTYALPCEGVTKVGMLESSGICATVSGHVAATKDSGGNLLPLSRLDDLLLVPGREEGPRSSGSARRPTPVVTYQVDGSERLLAVDSVLDRRELVVKPLGAPLERLGKYSGAALLDDGSVALVLDMVNLTGRT